MLKRFLLGISSGIVITLLWQLTMPSIYPSLDPAINKVVSLAFSFLTMPQTVLIMATIAIGIIYHSHIKNILAFLIPAIIISFLFQGLSNGYQASFLELFFGIIVIILGGFPFFIATYTIAGLFVLIRESKLKKTFKKHISMFCFYRSLLIFSFVLLFLSPIFVSQVAREGYVEGQRFYIHRGLPIAFEGTALQGSPLPTNIVALPMFQERLFDGSVWIKIIDVRTSTILYLLYILMLFPTIIVFRTLHWSRYGRIGFILFIVLATIAIFFTFKLFIV